MTSKLVDSPKLRMALVRLPRHVALQSTVIFTVKGNALESTYPEHMARMFAHLSGCRMEKAPVESPGRSSQGHDEVHGRSRIEQVDGKERLTVGRALQRSDGKLRDAASCRPTPAAHFRSRLARNPKRLFS